jgi:ubiquinone/menaquinone biosynthesis C-methylase UbiE
VPSLDTEQMFDQLAEAYDAWFLENRVVLASEVLLLGRAVGDTPGHALSVGCGSGLFEQILRTQHGIDIRHGIEPSEGMAAIARQRGMTVESGMAEDLPHDDASFDTVIFNGSPSYITALDRAFRQAARVLRPDGHIVVLDVPSESSYALLYRLAGVAGDWDDPRVREARPAMPYPIELAAGANWRSTPEKVELLRAAGFTDFAYWQTLTRHPRYSNDAIEQPTPGYDRGDYVAIRAGRTAG